MNEHIPDSSGLPLRAMVMVLLFLGVAFLLIGFQAMGSGRSVDDAAMHTAVTTTAPSPKPKPVEKPDVRVYNISEEAGVAARTAGQLRDAGWTVTEVDNLEFPGITATTVYFGERPGEQDAATAVGKLLDAPVEPRLPELADQAPGVIVLVTP